MGQVRVTPAGDAHQVDEVSRSYDFPSGQRVTLKNVREVIVRHTGTHRVRTADGHLHIIPSGWVRCEIEAKDWTF